MLLKEQNFIWTTKLAGYINVIKLMAVQSWYFSVLLLSSSSWNTEDQNPDKIKYMNLSAYIIIIYVINNVLGLYFLEGYESPWLIQIH